MSAEVAITAAVIAGPLLLLVWTFCAAAKLGGPEDGRPGPTPDPLLKARLYPRED